MSDTNETVNRIVSQLLEFQGTDSEGLELDKLLLRIFENPSLMSYLIGIGKSGENTELDFLALPPQGIEAVRRLVGPVEVEVLSYKVDGQPHTGFRFDIKALVQDPAEQPVVGQ